MKSMFRVVLAGLVALPLVAAAQSNLVVPEGVYTVLHFGQPVDKAVLPPDAPVDGKPYFMSGNRVLLLRFKASKTPVEAVIELADGSTRVLSLLPHKGAPTEVNVAGTDPVVVHKAPAAAPTVQSRDPNAYSVNVLAALVANGAVDGWESADPSTHPILVYDRLRAEPVRLWNGPDGDQVVDYALKSVNKATSLLDPSQFYRDGVAAALLIDNRVMPGHDGELLMLEKGSGPSPAGRPDLQTSEPEPPPVPGIQTIPAAGYYDGSTPPPTPTEAPISAAPEGAAQGAAPADATAQAPMRAAPSSLAPAGMPGQPHVAPVPPPQSYVSNPYANTSTPTIPADRMPPPINASALPGALNGAVTQANSAAAKAAGGAAQQSLPGGSASPGSAAADGSSH